LKQGAYAEASARAADALTLARRGSLRVAEEQSLVSLGRVEAARDDLSAARGHFENAVELAESIRLSVAGTDRRTSFFVSVREKYDLLIDVLMRLDERHPSDGLAERAFELSERARARSLLDLLGESRANVRQGIDPALLDREQALRASIVGKMEASDESLQQPLQAYREVQGEIRARSPRYAALVEPQPARLDDLRREILDGRTALVEYALDEERSYVWVITPSSFTSRRLPGRSVIEAAARRAYLALTDPNASDLHESLRALSRLLLDPIADRLVADRLAVVTEGALQYLPFAALLDSTGRPLVLSHEIVNLPSASTLQVLRREIDARPPAPRSLFVLGDPVFDSHDPRVRSSARGPRMASSATLERSARESGAGSLERLYFTRVETKGIAALARNEPSSSLLDFEANLDRVKDGSISAYRFVHFATHGLLNNRHPELSGLVFSLVDPQGRPRDGFLPAYDVYNLRLNADLVVLSACETALGEDIRGEGLVGLTRGFMYAGAARVVSSLWRVPDIATATLMRRFYRGILVDHLAPAASLREAQRSVRADPRWSAPYYWAGFVIQGEWR
jgi:CHAT domain-containing protein